MVTLGIDVLLSGSMPWKKGQRVGLLCNQASVNRDFVHTRTLLQQRPGVELSCLFSPQHGFYGEKQDNMIESAHGVDAQTGVVVFSLYGETRQPTDWMFSHLDVLLVDIVDVGTRVYTFLYTLAYCLEAAAKYGRKVVVLDRPNPLGGDAVEGNILDMEYSSFVGRYPLPMRHGLTFGELAGYLNREYGINAELEVVPMRGWKRSMYYRDTGLNWVFPSPNMPTPETAVVYPGQVIWEGTSVSEGRGTTLPFELVGAPWLEHQPILEKLAESNLPGCFFRPLVFEPTSGKYAGTPCIGFQLHVTDRLSFKPYRTSLVLLQAVYLLYPESFEYKQPPYEYEYEKLPMDLILGDRVIRENLEQGMPVAELERSWQEALGSFDQLRRQYFIYS
ncbi:MAG: DUF1343 domain-containing protein [Desulfocapsaceae bacterium]|jgi:uncharacterized protein YbbC (DUF1343 family)|nr:DUF1343 domain-containing protein [Desulfocapsaceae bacterium]